MGAMGGQAKEKKTLLGQILLAQGALTQAQLDKALNLQSTGRRLGRILVEMGVVTEGQLARALAQQWKRPPNTAH